MGMIGRLAGIALATALPPGRGGRGPRVQAQDTLTHHFVDSVVVRSPLPDPLVPIVQWIFQKPGWLMAGGIVVGALVALAVLMLLWRRRRAIGTWLVTRDRGAKLAMLGAVGPILLLMLGTGVKAYDYMMHDNDFCRAATSSSPAARSSSGPTPGPTCW